ncbi:MAG: hypothetical protein ACHQPH_11530 [Reyranellales bacterium]
MNKAMAASVGLTLGLTVAFGSASAWAQRPGGNVEQPVVRSLNWFSYVAADDIRAACRPGGRSRIRLVYNALWEEQVRTYEILLQPDGSAALHVGVLTDQGPATNVSSIFVSEFGDLTGPWRMHKAQRLLSPADTGQLMGLLQASTAFGPPRDGLRLPDNDFWWTVASCRDGVWGFQAYHYPTDRFANVRFSAKLFALDNVGITVNRPRNLEPAELRRDPNMLRPGRGDRADRWMLVVGKDGLRPR